MILRPLVKECIVKLVTSKRDKDLYQFETRLTHCLCSYWGILEAVWSLLVTELLGHYYRKYDYCFILTVVKAISLHL